MIIYSSLFFIAVISGPVWVDAVELKKADHPIDGKFIVTTAPGVITEGGGEIGSPQADKILQIIAGPDGDNIIAQSHDGDDIGTQYHGEVEQVYRSVMEGFAATLDRVGLQNVLNSPDVVGVEQDGYVELDQVRSWDLDLIDDENLPPDQSSNPTFGNSGQGVTAYVIDTGILASHVEFEGRATQEFDSTGGSNTDCHGHGTHVAGTVGAKTYGVANKVKLVGVKVLSCSGKGSLSGFIAGIDWVAANAKKPATANISLGGIRSIAVNTSIKNLVTSGVTTVVVAGNNSGDVCQKSTKSELSAITVASATQANTRSSFSNWDKCVDVFAPGSGIKSPWIGSNTATKIISGTSMASPHVCGTVALYLGQDSNLSPTAVALKIQADYNSKKILNSRYGTSNRMLVVGGSGEKQFTSSPEVQATKGTSTDSRVWGVNKNNNIYYRNGQNGSWIKIAGAMKQVSVSCGDSHVWSVNSVDNIYYRAGKDGSWVQIGGKLKWVSVSCDGFHVWGVNSANDIYYRKGKNGFWVHIPGKLKQVSVSKDGSHVWGVHRGNQIYYRNQKYGFWTQIGGRLKNVSVSCDGSHVWGVNADNNIYYRNGKNGSWTQIGGELKNVSVSCDGSHVWGVNAYNNIYYRNGKNGSWTKIGGGLTQVSVE